MLNIYKYILAFTFIVLNLNAEKLNCVYYAHYNHSTKEKNIYTVNEQKEFPPFYMNKQYDKIYVDLPSGNKEKFILIKNTNNENVFFSQNNYYLRELLDYQNLWAWDMNLKGTLQTILLMCKDSN